MTLFLKYRYLRNAKLSSALILSLLVLSLVSSVALGQTEQSDKPLARSETAIRANAIKLVDPTPPADAKTSPDKIVQVEIAIDEQGNVTSAIAHSGSSAMQTAAVDAARSSKFKPILLSGKPAKVTSVLTYNFGSDKPKELATVSYAQLLDRVKKKDKFVDFTALRMTYTESPDYDPYGPDNNLLNPMMTAFNGNNYKQAAEQAEKVLEKCYVVITAHIVAAISYDQLKDNEKADFHRYIARGLIDSITESGDGMTQQTAYVVISTKEEYTILQLRGLRPTGQALLRDDGHSYDKLMAIDPKTNEKSDFYFQIDKVMGHWDKIFKK